MKRCVFLSLVVLVGLVSFARSRADEPVASRKVRVLVAVGGHGYDDKVFAAKFGSMPDLQYTKIQMPQQAKLLKPGLEKMYDVIVMFDWAKTSEEDNKAFGELLKQGIGLVSMHANLLSHEGWSEWRKIVGCKWCFKEEAIDGKKYGPAALPGSPCRSR